MFRARICGNYTVDSPRMQELGRGSFAIVYLGYNVAGDKVAIKVISKDINNPKQINNEISIMNYIKDHPHKNIVKCYDIIEDNRNAYIVMEYCNSGSLYDLLEKVKHTDNKCLSEIYAKYYFCQIMEGIAFLKRNNIMHRDIKTKNILLHDNKDIKIADFGIAVKSYNMVTDIHSTICGSPLSMAPEVLYGYMNRSSPIKYDDTVDIWSIGIILYQLVYGTNPYNIEIGEVEDIHNKIVKNEIIVSPKQPTGISLSSECVYLIKKMLQLSGNRITWDGLFSDPWINNLGFIISNSSVSYADEIIQFAPCTVIESNENSDNGEQYPNSLFNMDS